MHPISAHRLWRTGCADYGIMPTNQTPTIPILTIAATPIYLFVCVIPCFPYFPYGFAVLRKSPLGVSGRVGGNLRIRAIPPQQREASLGSGGRQ